MVNESYHVGHSGLELSEYLIKRVIVLVVFAVFVIFWVQFVFFLIKVDDYLLEIDVLIIVFLSLEIDFVLKNVFQEHENGPVDFVVIHKRILLAYLDVIIDIDVLL